MKVAVSILRWFPWGGLQRDCGAALRELVARGHEVTLLTLAQEDEVPTGVTCHVLPASARTNHGRIRDFSERVRHWLADTPHDVHLGFNKIPGLDIYFAGDSCFAHKMRTQRPFWYRWLPRYRVLAELEHSVFTPAAGPKLLMIAQSEQAHFQRIYGTEPERMDLLPPGIDETWLTPPDRPRLRSQVCEEFGLAAADPLFLFVGSGYEKKGLDRALQMLADVRKGFGSARLLVAGLDREQRFRRLAERLSIADAVHFLGGRDDVPRLMGAADWLLHPARDEAGGNVLLEALASGLPVVATDVCGFADHLRASGAAEILTSPWDPTAAAAALGRLMTGDRVVLERNALEYVQRVDVTSRPMAIASAVEQWVGERQ